MNHPLVEQLEAYRKARGLRMLRFCTLVKLPYVRYWKWVNYHETPSKGYEEQLLKVVEGLWRM